MTAGAVISRASGKSRDAVPTHRDYRPRRSDIECLEAVGIAAQQVPERDLPILWNASELEADLVLGLTYISGLEMYVVVALEQQIQRPELAGMALPSVRPAQGPVPDQRP